MFLVIVKGEPSQLPAPRHATHTYVKPSRARACSLSGRVCRGAVWCGLSQLAIMNAVAGISSSESKTQHTLWFDTDDCGNVRNAVTTNHTKPNGSLNETEDQ